MNNYVDLSVDYVMWGQRIWEKGVNAVGTKWSSWPYQKCTTIKNCVNGDRGDNTANHWYDHRVEMLGVRLANAV